MKHWMNKSGKKRLVEPKIFLSNPRKPNTYLVVEVYNRYPNKANVDSNTIWQQVVTSLNEQASIRESLPIGGGFISK